MRFPSKMSLVAIGLSLAACSGRESDKTDAPSTPPSAEVAPASVASGAAAPAAATAPDAAEKQEAEEKAAADAKAAEAKSAEVQAAEVKAAEATKAAAAKTAPVPTKVAIAAPPSFARCAVCHTAEKGGEDKLGPNLFGVYGAKAGQGGFAFSQALKDSGLVFNEQTLHAWLENPRALVPGNRMSFPGLKDPAKRQEIIDYLKANR